MEIKAGSKVGIKWLENQEIWDETIVAEYKKQYGTRAYYLGDVLWHVYNMFTKGHLDCSQVVAASYEFLCFVLTLNCYIEYKELVEKEKDVKEYSRNRDYVRACRTNDFRIFNKYFWGG
jgi:hypothetical protein